MRILGVLSCRNSEDYQNTERIHHRMDFGGKASTTSAESLTGFRAMSCSGTMLMSTNVCPINHDVVHVSLQGKKLKNSGRISSFLPTPESGIYSFPRAIFFWQSSPWRSVLQHPMCGIEKVPDVTSRSPSSRRTFCRQYRPKSEPEVFSDVIVVHCHVVTR